MIKTTKMFDKKKEITLMRFKSINFKNIFDKDIVNKKNKYNTFINNPIVTKLSKNNITILFSGFEIILKNNNTFEIIETCGG
jgi:hypothetical protein